LSAWRLDALFVVIFLCVRRLSLDPVVIRRLRFAFFGVALILTGFALWEAVDKVGFNNFLTNTIDLPGYKADVLGNHAAKIRGSLLSTGSVGNTTYVRGGSLFNEPLMFGFFMVIPFGLALERVAARRPSMLALAAAGGSLASVFLSLTRGAVLGAVCTVLIAVAFGVSRVSQSRLRLILAVALSVVVLAPMAGHSALWVRMQTIFQPSSDQDTQLHVSRTKEGFEDLLRHPLGHGLGTNNQTAVLFEGDTALTTEDSYLETGTELGIPAMLLFVATLLMMLARLRERSKRLTEGAGLAGGAWLAGCGLAIGALVLQTWYELAVALVFWTIAGLALADTGRVEQSEPGPLTTVV
jgi:hypothetical protein